MLISIISIAVQLREANYLAQTRRKTVPGGGPMRKADHINNSAVNVHFCGRPEGHILNLIADRSFIMTDAPPPPLLFRRESHRVYLVVRRI